MIKMLLAIVLCFFTGIAFSAVNINTASQAELETLQGIGPTKAKAIIEHREKVGLFASVDDLEKVSGIGPGTIKQLRDAITVEVVPSPEPAVSAAK